MIVDAEIETIPRDQTKGSRLRNFSDTIFGGGEVILDSWLHQDILKFMPDANRRGRPDIVHHALSLSLSSLAYRRGYLDIVIHTRNNEVFWFGKNVEVPQNYFEFLHMLGQLYAGDQVCCGDKKIMLEKNLTLSQVIARIAPEVSIVMTPEGENKNLGHLLQGFSTQRALIMFGGFPIGDYRSPAYDLSEIGISLGPEWLNINAVTAELLRSLPK